MYAGTTGKIKGKIIDSQTKEPLFGANIIVENTTLGAASDINGEYFIINILPGKYTLVVSFIGYKQFKVLEVEVFSDRTTTRDIEITPASLTTNDIVIIAQRDKIETDRTSTASYISSQQIESLPAQEIGDLLQLQAGIVKGASGALHMRGGRGGEIAYLIDGVPVTDEYRGGSAVGLENNWVQELQVISGTFNAEYGQAQSGVVNIVSKEGSKTFGGRISVSGGDYLSTRDDIFMNIKKVSLAEKDATLTLYGPMGFGDFSFYSSIRYNSSDGWLYGQRRSRIDDTVPIQAYIQEKQKTQTDLERVYGIKIPDSLQTGDGSYVAMNPSEKYSFYAKASGRLSQDIKVSYSSFYNQSESKSFSNSRRYSPDGARNYYNKNNNQILSFNHVLSKRTFQTLSFSYYLNNSQSYLYSNPLDPRYRGTAYSFEGFYYGGTDNNRSDITNSAISAKYDLTSQFDNYNQLKVGAELKKHTIDYSTLTTISDGPVYKDPNLRVPDLNTANNDKYKVEPIEASLFVQDKVELNSVIFNAGVRVDYWNPRAKVPENLRAETKTGDGIRLNSNLIDADTRLQFSPRLGLAFPISSDGVVHVSYGHFFQLPKFNAIFTNYEFEVELGGLSTTMGNANLKPERTIAYEIGLQQVIMDMLNLEITAFYKDINNLLTQEIINTDDKKVYARYTNRDYGNVKGITVSLRSSFSKNISGSVDYTYQVAKGNASDPTAVFSNFQSNPPKESEKQVLPLDWDQRHTLNASLMIGDASDWGMTIIGRFATGQPYTPSNPSSQLTTQFENSDRKPSNYNIDLNLYKMLKVMGHNVKLFCQIYNLTDKLNEKYVYSSTGRADYPYRTYSELQLVRQNPNFTVDEIDLSPQYYTEPRRVIVGFSFDF
jgi:outer membrane receptor protein involved in Fe transport